MLRDLIFGQYHSSAKPLPSPVIAAHQGNYAIILNYPERELRYMDAGE
jgi:hypothetical protein